MLGFLGSLLYRGVVATLEAIRFYDVRNQRYAGIVRECLRSVPAAGVVADVGCGIGAITRQLGYVGLLVGVDRNREMLSHFRDPMSPRLQARAEQLPFKDGRLDAIVAISLVEHITDQSGFFRELSRVLEPGGWIVLQVPELDFPVEPHTKWPLLGLWRPALRERILKATGYADLNLSTTLATVIQHARHAGCPLRRLIPIWHFRIARLIGRPMGYFLLLQKGSG